MLDEHFERSADDLKWKTGGPARVGRAAPAHTRGKRARAKRRSYTRPIRRLRRRRVLRREHEERDRCRPWDISRREARDGLGVVYDLALAARHQRRALAAVSRDQTVIVAVYGNTNSLGNGFNGHPFGRGSVRDDSDRWRRRRGCLLIRMDQLAVLGADDVPDQSKVGEAGELRDQRERRERDR